MCGITGLISSGSKDVIKKMTDALLHRGPDDSGYYRDESIALGQRRLSIIDLSTGKQPISNENNTLQLICNGEIYNSPELRNSLIQKGHVFKTTTDVEVILHLYEEYGIKSVQHLQGMFAFAIWDSERQKLFLARDHMGQKPLYFCKQNGIFMFASEVKALLASGMIQPEIDLEGLWHYVSLRFIPDKYSLFKNVQKLPAAHTLVWTRESLKIDKYWQLDFTKKISGSEREITDQLDEKLQETVKSHLLADVQVGAFLSGGIDSSTIAAMMAKQGAANFPAFSIGVKEQKFNELPYARMVSQKYKLKPFERIVEADLINLIPSMIYHMDEPSDPFGAGVYLVSQVAGKEVKVVLGGDGGDENFAGYDRFAGNRIVDYYCLLPRWFRKSIMRAIIERIPESFGYKSVAQKATWLNEMSFFAGGERYAQSMSILRFTQDDKKLLFSDKARAGIHDYDSIDKILNFYDADSVDHVVDRMLYTDLMTRMPDHLLALVDRMTMAHSLESRSPLIDYKLVEFAASIPANLKLKGKDLKYILKRVAQRYLPDELIYRKKQGFGFPMALWMRTELKDFIINLTRQSRFIDNGIFNRQYIDTIVNEHLNGRKDHNFRIWILINLEIWHRLYFEGQSIESMQDFIQRLNRPQ